MIHKEEHCVYKGHIGFAELNKKKSWGRSCGTGCKAL